MRSIVEPWRIRFNTHRPHGSIEVPHAGRLCPPVSRIHDKCYATNSDGMKFEAKSASLVLIGAVLLAESYLFGFSAKACGDLGWGLYAVMISPLFLYYKAYVIGIAAGGIIAFCGGGVLSRLARIPTGRAIAVFIMLALIIATTGYWVTPVSHEACSAL